MAWITRFDVVGEFEPYEAGSLPEEGDRLPSTTNPRSADTAHVAWLIDRVTEWHKWTHLTATRRPLVCARHRSLTSPPPR